MSRIFNWLRYLLYALRGAVNVLLLFFGFTLICLLAGLSTPLTLISWRPLRLFSARLFDFFVYASGRLFRLCFAISGSRHWQIEGDLTRRLDKTCILISNHLSWVDPFVKHSVLGTRLPTRRFLIKEQLTWLPIFGQAFMGAGFVPLKRYSASAVAKNPKLLQKDRQKITRSCARLTLTPSAITVYPEGTRRTAQKFSREKSGLKKLLRPHIGGLATLLEHIPDIDTLCDVSIVYPPGPRSFLLLLCGFNSRLKIHIRFVEVPPQLRGDASQRTRQGIRKWFDTIWRQKDDYLVASNAP